MIESTEVATTNNVTPASTQTPRLTERPPSLAVSWASGFRGASQYAVCCARPLVADRVPKFCARTQLSLPGRPDEPADLGWSAAPRSSPTIRHMPDRVKVFISWSGDESRAVAAALHDWLPKVIQAVVPWMSERDIAAGDVGVSEISKALEDCDCGIVCLTPENIGAPWIHFEAGAIFRRLNDRRVVPLLHRVEVAQIQATPLGQLQAKKLHEKQQMKDLLSTVNSASQDEKVLDEQQLGEALDMWWGRLEESVGQIPASQAVEPLPPERSLDDIFNALARIEQRIPYSNMTVITDLANYTTGLGLGDSGPAGSRAMWINLGDRKSHIWGIDPEKDRVVRSTGVPVDAGAAEQSPTDFLAELAASKASEVSKASASEHGSSALGGDSGS